MKIIYLLRAACLGIAFFSCSNLNAEPWRINEAMNTPSWLSITGQQRVRFESLHEQFRNGADGNDQAFLLRTLLKSEVSYSNWKFVAEMQDSRSVLAVADPDTSLSTSVVNPLELLQAYVSVSFKNSNLKAGRFTMDIGSRRLVARNRFRNTLNNFTGLDWQWTGQQQQALRLFYTLPVQRLVEGKILENNAAFDKQDDEVSFWGIYYKAPKFKQHTFETYLFGLHEEDSPGRATSNRELYTIGFRLYKPAAINEFNYQIESVLQSGESHASRTATTKLDHTAHFQHVEIGYSFQHSWNPRLLLQYDYASGDSDRNDADNNRFTTLFGARRFDFGPTSLYGPFARANISSPGIRIKFKPAQTISSFIAFRGFWLASNEDAWTTTGIRNTNSSYIASQLEARLRWDIVPKNLRLEVGGAHLFAGDLMRATNKNSSTYLYSQMLLKF